MHADRAKSGSLEHAPVERGRPLQIAVQVALDVIGLGEQPEVRNAAEPMRERADSGSQHRRWNVVKDIVADHDVEAAADAWCVQRSDVTVADVAACAVAPNGVRARLDSQVFQSRPLAAQGRAPESLAAADIERVARAASEQLLGERDDRASDACALGSGGDAMARVTVPAIVVRLAEAVGQLALRGISMRSGVELCTLSR